MAPAGDAAVDNRSNKATPSRSTGGGRAVVTLTPEAAVAARRLGRQMGGISVAETVRRGLMVLDFALSLDADEELAIFHKGTRETDRVRFPFVFEAQSHE